MKAVAAEINAMTQDQIAKMEAEGAYTLHNTPYTLIPEDVEIITEDMPGWLVANNGILTIALDIELTDELIEEGIARELINRIQNLRKESGFEVTDRVKVVLEENASVRDALSQFGGYVCEQTLATSVEFSENPENAAQVEWEDGTLKISVKKQ
jgi:isoleucyl-tRNA synthetase